MGPAMLGLCGTSSSVSFLEALVGDAVFVEIVLDSAKSHATYNETWDVVQKRKVATRAKRNTSCRNQYKAQGSGDDKTELDLDDLRDCLPSSNKDYLHNSYPGREDSPGGTNGHRGALCRWASSSDSDFAYRYPMNLSFDRMLKEASSSTNSARTNVSRPVRRNSLKSTQLIMPTIDSLVLHSPCGSGKSVDSANDPNALHTLCSKFIETIDLAL